MAARRGGGAGRSPGRRAAAVAAREQALAELEALPGIGGFSAELILLRSRRPRHFPRHECRLQRAMARAYQLEAIPSRSDCWPSPRSGALPHLGVPAAAHRAGTELEDDTYEIANQARLPAAAGGPRERGCEHGRPALRRGARSCCLSIRISASLVPLSARRSLSGRLLGQMA